MKYRPTGTDPFGHDYLGITFWVGAVKITVPRDETLEFDGEFVHWRDDVFAVSAGSIKGAVKHGWLEAV